MQNLGKHIITFLLAGIFLLSFTGIRMILHHCFACDETEVYLFAEHKDCCTNHYEHHAACDTGNQASCCSTEDEENTHCENCCKEEVVYFKNDYETKHERQTPKIQPIVVAVLAQILSNLQPEADFYPVGLQLEKDNSPPELFTGKSFIIYTRHIKIS